MATALDIVTGAARLLGVVRNGESLAAAEAADGLTALNDMLASWSNESLHVYSRTWESFTLVAGTASYSIGTGQTFNTSKPLKIVDGFTRDVDIDQPLEIISDEQYQSIGLKTLRGQPQALNYDNGHPYGTIRLYSVPDSNYGLHILSEKALTSFATLATSVDLPAGANRALRNNLALEIAPEYGIEPSALIVRNANKSRGAIKLNSAKARGMQFKGLFAPTGNIYSGWY